VIQGLIPASQEIQILQRLGRRLTRPRDSRIGWGKPRSGREPEELEQGTALHEFVLPHAEHPWLQDRARSAQLVHQRRGTGERGDQRTFGRLRGHLLGNRQGLADAEGSGIGSEEQAE
jgi:hypothetical protein